MKIVSAITTVNAMAAFVALMAHFLVGVIWFSVFGKAYEKLTGMDVKTNNKWLPLGMIAHVFYTLALAVIVNLAAATTVLEGLIIGILVSVGFIATLLINEMSSINMPFRLFLLKFGDELISLCVAAVILAVWK